MNLLSTQKSSIILKTEAGSQPLTRGSTINPKLQSMPKILAGQDSSGKSKFGFSTFSAKHKFRSQLISRNNSPTPSDMNLGYNFEIQEVEPVN